MNAQIDLIEGTTRDLSKSQWFTPSALAERVVAWAGVKRTVPDDREWLQSNRVFDRPMRVLEPSAGNGALVRPLVAAGAIVTAFDIDERYKYELGAACNTKGSWGIANFLELNPVVQYDLCVMNPPYENGLDVAFILHALKFAPRVVGIFTDRILFGVERKEGLWSKVRPTRIAIQSRRPFKGAQTDYVVLELVGEQRKGYPAERPCFVEWW